MAEHRPDSVAIYRKRTPPLSGEQGGRLLKYRYGVVETKDTKSGEVAIEGNFTEVELTTAEYLR